MIKKKNALNGLIKTGVLSMVLMVFVLGLMYSAPVFAAECGGAETAIIECADDEGGIWHLLNLIVDIASIGIGILGVIGISVAGVQFLTAKDSLEQTKKAKNRISQIVIGLALYVSIFVIVQWLLPGGVLNSLDSLRGVGSTSQIREQEEKRQEANNNNYNNPNHPNNPSSNPQKNIPKAQQLSDVAWRFAKGKLTYAEVAKATGYYDYMEKNCYKIGGGDCARGKKGYRTFCSGFVYNVVRYSGVDPNYPMKLTGKQLEYANNSSKWKNVTSKVNGKTSKLKPGDVLIKKGGGHTLMITEHNGKLYAAQAAVGNFEPKTSKITSKTSLGNSAGNLSNYQVFRIVE